MKNKRKLTQKRELILSSGIKIEYTLLRRTKNRRCYIYIRNREVEVRSPERMKIELIEKFIADKENWILKHLQKAEKNHRDPGESFLYRGALYPVSIVIRDSGSSSEMDFDGHRATFRIAKNDRAEILEEIQHLSDCFYKKTAPGLLMPRVEYWSDIMGLAPSKTAFRRARTRWGSCSSKNSISLNIRLVSLPEDLSDYIIVHELSHIRYKNHSSDFWRLVKRYIPQSAKHRQELKNYTL